MATKYYRLNTSDESQKNPSEDLSISASKLVVVTSDAVEKDKQIKLDEDIFEFECYVDNDYLILKLSEIDALAPFTYQAEITIDDLIQKHKVFKSVVLEDAMKHIKALFKKNKIKLTREGDEKIIFNITIMYFASEETFEIEAGRIMTNYKDSFLLKLYDIQKKNLSLLKEIETAVQKGNINGKELERKIKELKEKVMEKK